MKKIMLSALIFFSFVYGIDESSCVLRDGHVGELSHEKKVLCNKLIPFWEKFVKVAGSKYALLHHVICLFDFNYCLKVEEAIRNKGLFSANMLAKQGAQLTRKTLIEMEAKGLDYPSLDHEYDVVYFMPQRCFEETKVADYFCPSRIVRYLVRKDDYPLYNGLHRGSKNAHEKYFASKTHIDSDQKYTWDEGVSEGDYFPETYEKDHIPASRLIFYYPVTSADSQWAQHNEKEAVADKEYFLKNNKST